MLVLRRSLSHYFRFLNLLSHLEHRSNKLFSFARIINNSGYLIAGCCFSAQLDERTLLPKSNHVSGDLPASNTQSLLVQHLDDDSGMKRTCITNNETFSQITSVVNNAEKNEPRRKRQKTEEYKIDNTEDLYLENSSTYVSETPDLSKNEVVKSEVKKLENAAEKPKNYRPNYFVAIQVSDPQIIKSLDELQQHMLQEDERLKKSMIQLATLHITLMVMYIGDSETHARALKTLKDIHEEHNDELSRNPLKLEFKGLSHFQNRVLYAKLSSDDSFQRLKSLAESVRKHYTSSSIPLTDSKKDFTPHLTVVKIRDVWKRKKEHPKKIDPSLYKDFVDQYFGSQEVQSIQLLSMTDPKDEVGYYSGKEIYFSAFEPKVRRDYLNTVLETEEKKKNVKEMINALMKEKLK